MRDRLVGRAHTEEEKKKKKNTVLRPVKSTLADVESMKEVRKRKKKCLAVPLSEGKAETQEETGGSKDYTKRNSPLRCIDLTGFHARTFGVPAPRITHNRFSHFALSLSLVFRISSCLTSLLLLEFGLVTGTLFWRHC